MTQGIYRFPNRDCVNPDCGGSGWVAEYRSVTTQKYVGDFTDESKTGEKWNWNTPTEDFTQDQLIAIPCPDCNKLLREAYEQGRMKHHFAHRDALPNEEQLREANIAKAKKEFDA